MNLSGHLLLGQTETIITRSYLTVVPTLIAQFSGFQITSKRKRAQKNGLRQVGKQRLLKDSYTTVRKAEALIPSQLRKLKCMHYNNCKKQSKL